MWWWTYRKAVVAGSSSPTARRDRDDVADATDLEERRAVLRPLQHRAAQRPIIVRPADGGATRGAAAPRPSDTAPARPSAASGGAAGREPQTDWTIFCTCALVARRIRRRVLHLVRRVLGHLAPRGGLGERDPLACPTLIAVRTLTWKKTSSTATLSGRNSTISAASSPRSSARRFGNGSDGAVRMTPSPTTVASRARILDVAYPQRVRPVDAEHEALGRRGRPTSASHGREVGCRGATPPVLPNTGSQGSRRASPPTEPRVSRAGMGRTKHPGGTKHLGQARRWRRVWQRRRRPCCADGGDSVSLRVRSGAWSRSR